MTAPAHVSGGIIDAISVARGAALENTPLSQSEGIFDRPSRQQEKHE